MNLVTLKGTLPRVPRIMEPTGKDKKPIALFTVARRNGDLAGRRRGKKAAKQYRQVVVAEYIAVLNGGLVVETEAEEAAVA